MTKFVWKPITNRNNFGGRRPKSAIRFIAVHWTANTSKGATAMNHYRYFQNNSPGASAHYFVDDNEIVQIVGDTTIAYAVGGNQGYGVALNGCTNYNSISIEMCVNNGYSDKMLFNTIELVKELLRQFPNARVCRHWDATRKDCPSGFTGNNNARWNKFLNDIKQNRRMIIDTSKTSECRMVGGSTPSKPQAPISQSKPSTPFKGYYVLTSTPNDVLNVREKPSATSRIVSSYRDGSKIYVHEVIHTKDSTWYKIEYHKDKFGYVAARFCKGIN